MLRNLKQVPLIILAVEALCFICHCYWNNSLDVTFKPSFDLFFHWLIYSNSLLPFSGFGSWHLCYHWYQHNGCVYVSPNCQTHWCGEWSSGKWSQGAWVISQHLLSPSAWQKWWRLLSLKCHWETTATRRWEVFSHWTLTTWRKDTFLAQQWRDISTEISVQLPLFTVIQATV